MESLTLPNYFKLVNFHTLSKKEQVVHFLFFITVVAEIREDMTAKIIAHRINDKRHVIGEGEVREMLRTDKYHFQESDKHDLRDRQPGEVAYKLTERARHELIKKLNISFYDTHSYMKPIKMAIATFSILLILTIVSFATYHAATYSEISDLSWPQFRDRASLTVATPEEKATYILFFITEYIKFRKDMEPSVICDRLDDLGLPSVDPARIEQHFKDNPEYFAATSRQGAYKLTPAGSKMIYDKLALIPTPAMTGIYSAEWFLKYELPRGLLLLQAIATVAVSCFGFGFLFGGLRKPKE